MKYIFHSINNIYWLNVAFFDYIFQCCIAEIAVNARKQFANSALIKLVIGVFPSTSILLAQLQFLMISQLLSV